MTRYLIRATDPDQFRRAKALVDGRTRVFVTSERRLFLSTGDLPPDVQQELRSAGLRVAVEQPAYRPGFAAGEPAPRNEANAPDAGAVVLPPVRFRVTARDAAHLQAVRERIQGRAAIVATGPGLVIRTGMLSEALERELRDLGAAVAAVPGAHPPRGAASEGADRAKQALLERLRSQAPLGVPWSREDVYDDIGGPGL